MKAPRTEPTGMRRTSTLTAGDDAIRCLALQPQEER
jgi:hypothetical protein